MVAAHKLLVLNNDLFFFFALHMKVISLAQFVPVAVVYTWLGLWAQTK